MFYNKKMYYNHDAGDLQGRYISLILFLKPNLIGAVGHIYVLAKSVLYKPGRTRAAQGSRFRLTVMSCQLLYN